MAKKPEVFRKVSLDRLSSPEQLDQLMQVANAKGWLALASVGVLLGLAIVWSVVGSIPDRVSGQGILLRSGGVFEVVSQSEGRVVDLPIRVGDLITEGQVIARLAQPELTEKIRVARGRVAELGAQSKQMEELLERDAQVQSTAQAQRRRDTEQSIAAAEVLAASLRERITAQEQLVTQGLLTRQVLMATKQEHEQIRERIRVSRSQIAQMGVERLQTEGQHRQQLWASRNQLREAERELRQLESDVDLQSTVTTPYSGRVLEVMAEQGGLSERGQPILTVSLTGKAVKNLEAVVYIPSAQGKRIQPGMVIEIVPSTVRRESYGYLLGRVTYVSDFPATPQGMLRVLKNSKLVDRLSGQDAPYEVHADLIPDPDNTSQYRWSSSQGPPIRLQSGTVATAQVVVQSRRPILMVLPQLRDRLEPASRPVAGAPATAGAVASYRAEGGR
jgi:HlyD family secretion protein